VSQALDGSSTYERFVATITAKVGIIRMLYAQRFQPTMNPSAAAEPDSRPLVESALERHQAIQEDDHRRLRQIEGQRAQRPEDDVRGPELGGAPTQPEPTMYMT
jgi:hypothetical protein